MQSIHKRNGRKSASAPSTLRLFSALSAAMLSAPLAMAQERVPLFAPGMPQDQKPQIIQLDNGTVRQPDAAVAPNAVDAASSSDPFHGQISVESGSHSASAPSNSQPVPITKEQIEYLRNNTVHMQPNGGPPNSGPAVSTTSPKSEPAPIYISPSGQTFTNKPALPNLDNSSQTVRQAITTTPTSSKPSLADFGLTRQDVSAAQKTPPAALTTPTKTDFANATGKPANAVELPKPQIVKRIYTPPTSSPYQAYQPAPRVNCAQLQQQLYMYATSGALAAACQMEDQLARYCGGPRGGSCGGGGMGSFGIPGGLGFPF